MRNFTLAIMAMAAMAYSAEATAGKYMVDPAHTTVEFSVKHMLITNVKGTFGEFEGTIMLDEKDLTKTSASGTIKVASISTRNDKRDAHLTSADFFDAEKYPEITFDSKTVEKRESGYVMIGDFTMRGVTKEIEIPFEFLGSIKDPMGTVRIAISASAEINRQDYGVSWNKTLDGGGLIVGDNVKIELEIAAVQATEK